MGPIEFYNLKQFEKSEIFEATALIEGLPVFAVEKDWWVSHTLRTIFSMSIGKHLLFKGGTSLSKAWGLIDRFSEDIDLSLNREYLGFESGIISGTQVRKLRVKSHKYIVDTFYYELQKAFLDQGIDDLTFKIEKLGDEDQDPVSILIFYSYVTKPSEYLPPRIKVEIGGRSMIDPHTQRSIQSFVGLAYPNKSFADMPISISCINPERTYLEKLFLLHEEFQRPKDKIRVDRLSRHLFDIWKIYESDYRQKAMDVSLIKDIITHRARFNSMKGVDYTSHFPPNLNPIPPNEFIEKWESDYGRMQSDMFQGAGLPFDELITVVKKATAEYNNLQMEQD